MTPRVAVMRGVGFWVLAIAIGYLPDPIREPVRFVWAIAVIILIVRWWIGPALTRRSERHLSRSRM